MSVAHSRQNINEITALGLLHSRRKTEVRFGETQIVNRSSCRGDPVDRPVSFTADQ